MSAEQPGTLRPRGRRRRIRWRYVALGLPALAALAVAAGAIYQSWATARDLADAAPAGEMVEIRDRRIHLICQGEGEPTVILEASGLSTSSAYRLIQPALAPYTRACAYDRAGMGWSDPGETPRTASELVAELHEVLTRANVPGPYVMVGHSMGGFVSRLYASRHRRDVAGLVLIDSGHEDLIDALPLSFDRTCRLLSLARVASRLGLLRLADPFEIAGAEGVGRTDYALFYRPRVWDTVHDFMSNLDVTAREMVEAAPLRETLPVVVLTHTPGRFDGVLGPGLDPSEAELGEELWQELQEELGRLTPRTRHIVARNSGHMITEDEPDLVVGAIAELVSAIRRGDSTTFVI